jgi:predicted dehydrogenase
MAKMPGKVKWGVLSTAGIALRRAIPAMQNGEWSVISAIASRDLRKAEGAARNLGIAKAYGSYEELLADPEIEAIYNPLPNHLHVPWSIKAAEAGKHVLCEKPLSLNVAEAKTLLQARDRCGVKIGEAFMVRTHPQWLRTRELIRSGRIGELRSAFGYFGYFDRDPASVANIAAIGGGAIMDVGCYPIKTSRFIFGEEPLRVSAAMDRDPAMKVDVLTSAILEYPSGQCIFTAGMQVVYYQKMQFIGTTGRIDVEIPFGPPIDKPSRIFIDDGTNLYGGGSAVTESFPPCNQFTIQGDEFSKAIRGQGEIPNPLEDAIRNMAVIDAVYRSAETGKWETPERFV